MPVIKSKQTKSHIRPGSPRLPRGNGGLAPKKQRSFLTVSPLRKYPGTLHKTFIFPESLRCIKQLSAELKIKKPDTDKLIELLVNKYGLIKYKVINKLNRLNELYLKFKIYE